MNTIDMTYSNKLNFKMKQNLKEIKNEKSPNLNMGLVYNSISAASTNSKVQASANASG